MSVQALANNRIVARMEALRSSGTRGLAPYITAGDGGLDVTAALLWELEDLGAACVELGVPFSDPIADGPVLQAAAQRSLDAGTRLEGILDRVRQLRGEGLELPIALFSYANPLIHLGWDVACERLAAAGVDGLLVPDLPAEEGEALQRPALAQGLCPIFFVAPTTSSSRAQRAASLSRGFLYAIGRFGITGAATEFSKEAQDFLERMAGVADMPLAVGFGLRTPEDIVAATRSADVAIVGSALVQAIHDALQGANPNSDPITVARGAARTFLTPLLEALPR